jgi:hypothetical protein
MNEQLTPHLALPTTSRNAMHFAAKCIQTMLRCIRLICRKAALSPHCHQSSGVNNTAGSADSCKAVISLRNPWENPVSDSSATSLTVFGASSLSVHQNPPLLDTPAFTYGEEKAFLVWW